jgi:RHS repeat-associated protein
LLSRPIRARNPEQEVNLNLPAATDPITGNSQWTMAYFYDNNSNLTQKTDARNITTNYGYDALNRVTSRSYSAHPENTPAVSYFYDNQTLPSGAPAFSRGASIGKLVAVTYGGGAEGSYQGYDSIGRLAVSFQVTDSVSYQMSYGYDLAGNLTSQVYPSGKEYRTSFDSAGRINSVSRYIGGGFDKNYATQMQYAAHGGMTSMMLGNSTTETMSYNSRLQPTKIELKKNATNEVLLGLDYGYGTTNNNGNVLTQTIRIGTTTTINQSYEYDWLNRLTSAQESVNSTTRWTQTYDYDRFGNRTSLVNTGSEGGLLPTQTTTPVDPLTNRLTSSGYDTAGNVKTDATGNQFDYDAENRQVKYNNGAANYYYDGDGRRVKKTVGTTTTIFVYNAGGQLVAEYGQPQGEGGTRYLTSDHLGSTRVVTDSSGNVKARYDYLPFGEELNAGVGGRTTAMGYDAADSTRQRFTSKERDTESGLDYFLARYYSSAQGRFTSVDPIMASGRVDLPSSWNRYAYVWNNPLIAIDPDGKEGIVVSGQPGPHNNREHFLVNGLDRAKKQVQEYAKKKSGEKVTWFIYNESGKGGYTDEQIAKYKAAAEKAGINVQVVSDQQKIVDYVNEKTGGDSRSQDLVSNFTYIGHATPGDLDIGYVAGGISTWTSTELAFEDFNPNAFSADSCANLVGGCNTAVAPNVLHFEPSVAEQFADIVGGKVLASSVTVYYPGGVVSDEELVRPYGGKIVEIKGRGGRKK